MFIGEEEVVARGQETLLGVCTFWHGSDGDGPEDAALVSFAGRHAL